MRISQLPAERIEVNTTYLGGGFGRRFSHDFVDEALECSKATGRPVKVVRPREDDIRHGFFRPATYNRLTATIDASGKIESWDHLAVSPSILRFLHPPWIPASGLDGSAVQGANNLLYDMPNFRLRWVRADAPTPVGIWRSVGDSQNAFITQGFLDELAHAAGADPVEFRLRHLNATPQAQRLRAVLELAATKAGWGGPLPAGRFRGVAAIYCYTAFTAQVAEVSITKEGRIKVHKVTVALDSGWITSPDLVAQQAEGGLMYGLSAAMGERITVKNGAVEQSNFHDYPVLRYSDAPQVDFHLVRSQEPALSVGEPCAPCIAPAVANAVFAATGVRMRAMPFKEFQLPPGKA
jgi:isoquinoline 1-oxidoreductase subunit beta